MHYTQLGRTGLTVSRICLGTMNFGNQTGEPDSFAIMDRALASGVNFFDTAGVCIVSGCLPLPIRCPSASETPPTATLALLRYSHSRRILRIPHPRDVFLPTYSSFFGVIIVTIRTRGRICTGLGKDFRFRRAQR